MRHLSRREQAAVDGFVRRLRDRYAVDLRRVVLFGSRARGDANNESDFDFLVVVRMNPDEYWQHWRGVTDLAWDVELSHGIAISVVLKSVEAYAEMRRRQPLLLREIDRDGVTLWTSRSDAPMSASA